MNNRKRFIRNRRIDAAMETVGVLCLFFVLGVIVLLGATL
jgi:hypothetical protein